MHREKWFKVWPPFKLKNWTQNSNLGALWQHNIHTNTFPFREFINYVSVWIGFDSRCLRAPFINKYFHMKQSHFSYSLQDCVFVLILPFPVLQLWNRSVCTHLFLTLLGVLAKKAEDVWVRWPWGAIHTNKSLKVKHKDQTLKHI